MDPKGIVKRIELRRRDSHMEIWPQPSTQHTGARGVAFNMLT